MAAYVNTDGLLTPVDGSYQIPTAGDFSGPVGGNLSDLSLVPDLNAATPAYWQAFSPGLGLGTGGASSVAQASAGGTPWLLIGGLGFLAYMVMQKKGRR